jgi:hypothetical protein
VATDGLMAATPWLFDLIFAVPHAS